MKNLIQKLRRFFSALLYIAVTIALSILFLIFIYKLGESILSLDAGIATAIITGIVGLFGLIYSQWHAKKREIAEGHRPKKIEVYNIFFDITEEFFNAEKNNRTDLTADQEVIPKDIQDKFTLLNRGMIVWASPKVIKTWLIFREKSTHQNEKQNLLLYVDDILQAIRSDLGNSNYMLKRGDVVKLYLSDPSELDKNR